MTEQTIEYNLKQHVDKGYVIVLVDGKLSYLNADGTPCLIQVVEEQYDET